MPLSDSQPKIEFPAEIVILRKKNYSKKGKAKFFEHWYITIPATARKLIDKENKMMQVTLERIKTQD